MNYALLLECVQSVSAMQMSFLGNVNPELATLADELAALIPVEEVVEAPVEEVVEAPVEEVADEPV